MEAIFRPAKVAGSFIYSDVHSATSIIPAANNLIQYQVGILLQDPAFLTLQKPKLLRNKMGIYRIYGYQWTVHYGPLQVFYKVHVF